LYADELLKQCPSKGDKYAIDEELQHTDRAFNFTYRYIDDVLSINNSRFAEFLPLIYPPELEVKETTYTASSASFLDLMTFQEIRIIATGPCIANQLRDVNTICRRSWYIAAHVWKIYVLK
jgi:hypothetical protein